MIIFPSGNVRGWERGGITNESASMMAQYLNGRCRRTYSKQLIKMCRVKDNDDVSPMQ